MKQFLKTYIDIQPGIKQRKSNIKLVVALLKTWVKIGILLQTQKSNLKSSKIAKDQKKVATQQKNVLKFPLKKLES